MDNYRGLTNEELFELVQQRADTSAYQELYERLRPSMHGFALSHIEDSEQAKDLIQDIFLLLWQKRKEINIISSVKSYLFGAMYNQIAKLGRKQKVIDDYIDYLKNDFEEGFNETDSIIAVKELHEQMETAMGMMSEKEQFVFLQFRFSEMKHKEISLAFNIPQGSVQNYVRKATARLRKVVLRIYSIL